MLDSTYLIIETELIEKYPDIPVADLRTACMISRQNNDPKEYITDEVINYVKSEIYKVVNPIIRDYCIGGGRFKGYSNTVYFNMNTILGPLKLNKDLCIGVISEITSFIKNKDNNIMEDYLKKYGYEPDTINVIINSYSSIIREDYIHIDITFDKKKVIEHFKEKYKEKPLQIQM